jgi:hypothetical protein
LKNSQYGGIFTNNKVIKTGLTFGIFALLIVIAVQPGIANLNPIIDKRSYCVTTEYIGLNNKHTISMTYEEIQELEVFLKNLCLKLENAESKEDIIDIYNKQVQKLNKFGLIEDKNLKLAQKLITSRYKKSRSQTLLMDDNENKFCLVIGKTKNTIIDGIPFRFFAQLADKTSSDLLLILLLPIIMITDFIDDYRPILLDAFIYWGAPNENWGHGWVWTLGINGIKSWNGNIIGRIQTTSTFYTGIVGFIGINIMINLSEDTNFFIGFARHVKIDYTK